MGHSPGPSRPWWGPSTWTGRGAAGRGSAGSSTGSLARNSRACRRGAPCSMPSPASSSGPRPSATPCLRIAWWRSPVRSTAPPSPSRCSSAGRSWHAAAGAASRPRSRRRPSWRSPPGSSIAPRRTARPQRRRTRSVYLKQLELVGFKSFPTRTRLRFEPGITAIVGPNGAGKSNLADAVRWALGEQSARALRGRRGEDVIFAGGGTRHPVGMAEVTLLLDNAEGRFPLPYAEVALTRRLYRSGEGEYLVNGSRVRLRDLTDWLLSVGLGPDSYCVVGQGTIEQLVLQRPEDRRVLLEDAADVRRHALRLAETEQKLAATAANLERARDLTAALAPEVERLRRAARRARVCAEAAGLAAAYYGAALAQAEAQAASTAAALAAATAQRTALEQELARVETARAADEAARRPREVRLAALRDQVGRLRAERERL